jgi:hypothetical protein
MKTIPLAVVAIQFLSAAAWAESFSVKGKYYETCACAVSCPCGTGEFKPTEGHCDAVSLFHIDKGSVGKTHLDGLNVAIVLKSPQDQVVFTAFSKGEMDHFAVYLDEKATEAQRAAFPKLLEGMFGKLEVKNAKPPAFVPIKVESDGQTATIEVGSGKLTAAIVNIKIGEEKHGKKTVAKRIKLEGVVPFPFVKNVTQGKSTSFHYEDGDTKWDYKERNAYFADFATKGKLAAAAAPAKKEGDEAD